MDVYEAACQGRLVAKEQEGEQIRYKARGPNSVAGIRGRFEPVVPSYPEWLAAA